MMAWYQDERIIIAMAFFGLGYAVGNPKFGKGEK